MLHANLTVGAEGRLYFAGQDVVSLAERYGTPAYLLDEARVRENCRRYVRALRAYMGKESLPLYASKALCFRGMYAILQEEGMGADAVSAGEIYTALSAGFPAQKLFFHGNNKLPEEIDYALEQGVGYFIVDNPLELERLNAAAGKRGLRQKVLLRLTPGIDPHTFAAVNTGRIDCQFGMAIETGQAMEFVLRALAMEHLDVRGYHCHIGSQIADCQPFVRAAQMMIDFACSVRRKTGYAPTLLNLGGGFAVRYLESDTAVDIEGEIAALAAELKRLCGAASLPLPALLLEPGRSIVADAGITLYTAGSIKTIENYRSYVVVDGGMSDNPRYALYGAPYTVMLANRANEKADTVVTVTGRCCETGALIQENVRLPQIRTGDILAVLSTGAYNYSMASNYNRICRPPVVILNNGESRLGVRRETFADLLRCDV